MKYNHTKNTFTVVYIYKLSLLCTMLTLMILPSCNYLDVVPDNIPTIDYAFRTREEARRYLYGCLSFMPEVGRMSEDPAMHGSDEVFTTERAGNNNMRWILLGAQGTVNPYSNYWASRRNSQTNVPKALWTGISDCNIFLENLDKPFDLWPSERSQWRGEALFAKAYMHFWLFRQYGPIPLMKVNEPITAESNEVQMWREPVDSVVNYIVALLDEAAYLLPLDVEDEMQELGRPTKRIAKALKAQVLTLAASPLFNCNDDWKGYIDNRGIQLFPQDKSQEKAKWERAAVALKEAIDTAQVDMKHRLYDAHIDYPNASGLHEPTLMAMQVRGAVTERWNPEIVWGNSRANNINSLQQMCLPVFASDQKNGAGNKSYGVPLHIMEQFYTKNGLPIEDDKDWVGRDPMQMRLRNDNSDEFYYFQQNYASINLHFDREARFYSSINFDGGKYLGNGRITSDKAETDLWSSEMRFAASGMQGWSVDERSNITGEICKKLVHYRVTASGQSYSNYNYAFPIIRLADLYLMYAEALNECLDDGATPGDDVYEYIDLVRARTGLKGVVESWRDHAIDGRKNLPLTKEGMREIIQRERLNELAFEGARFWDLRRWKLAEKYLNRTIEGWDVFGWNMNEFYKRVPLATIKFEKKDYFFPIRANALMYNVNLKQSPGWENN